MNNVSGKGSQKKTWLSIRSMQKLWSPIFYREPLIWSTPFYVFIFWQHLFGNIVQKKYSMNTQKTHKQKLFFQKHLVTFFL